MLCSNYVKINRKKFREFQSNVIGGITRVFCNNFISNARLKLTKNQARAKEHHEAELFLCENYPLSSSTLSSKNNR